MSRLPSSAAVAAPDALPVVLGPADIAGPSAGKPELVAWLCQHRDSWRWSLHAHGAILFRGFVGMTGAADFEDVATAVSPNLMDYVGGTAPRQTVKGMITTASEAPPRAVIAQHQEMSYTERFPDKLMFFCEVAPVSGGQTPLTDMRKVMSRLPVSLVREFERRGVRLTRELAKQTGRVGRKVWPDVFGTTDRAEVERIATERGWRVEWLPREHIRLLQEVRPATITHPGTGDLVWFNQAQNYGRSLLQNAGRWLATLLFPDRGIGDCAFGDGAAIPYRDLLAVRRAIRDETVGFDWQRGDVLLIDNILVSHGRRPFRGERRVLAALIRDSV